MSEELNPRERTGRWMRFSTASIVGAPITLLFLLAYLFHVRAGHADRWATFSYAAVAVAMAIMPLWLLSVVSLLA